MSLLSGPDTELPELSWDESAFRAWLVSKAATDTVGITCAPTRCPLATWRAELNEDVAVGASLAFVYVASDTSDTTPSTKMALPPWATQFIRQIDRKGAPMGVGIRAKDALAALDALHPPTQPALF